MDELREETRHLRTLKLSRVMSALCQKKTHASQHKIERRRLISSAVHPSQIEERLSSPCVMSNGEPV
jgi:hypothetical protein